MNALWILALLSLASAMALVWLWHINQGLRRQHQADARAWLQAENERMQHAVRQRTAQLTELTHHLQTTRENERERLAADLRDVIGPLLTEARLDAARLRVRLGAGVPKAQERLAHMAAALDGIAALQSRIVEELRPSALTHLGLVPALETLVRDFGERTGLPVRCDLVPVQLPSSLELMVYRVVQEAFTNIGKHACAQSVAVHLATQGGRIDLSVRDDGQGFDPRVRAREAYGLVGMRYRVEAEGGRLDVVSAPHRGTLIRLWLPACSTG